MAIYAGKNYARMDVHIGAPDIDAWHQLPIADDVIGSVRHWFNAALERDDVLYFGVFWSGRPVGQILLPDMDGQTSLVAYHLFSPAERGHLRHLGQRGLHLLVRMDRPIVLHHVDPLGIWIGHQQLAIEHDQIFAADDVGVQIIEATSQAIERTNQPPLFVISWRYPGCGLALEVIGLEYGHG
jgi:hypothetical protein